MPIDAELQLRYIYNVEIKKLDAISKELLKFNFSNQLLSYIKEIIDGLDEEMYQATRKNTLKLEKEFIKNNINLEIVIYALNKLIKKRKLIKDFSKETILKKKTDLDNKLNKRFSKKELLNLIDRLDLISLVLFINYTTSILQNKKN